MIKRLGLVLATILLLNSIGFGEEIIVGPEGGMTNATKGFIELDTGRNEKRRVLIQVANIVCVKSGPGNDNNSDNELMLGTGGAQLLVIKIPQRVMTYDSIKNVIMDALR